MVHLGGRSEHRGRTQSVHAVGRRDALRERGAGRTAIGRGAGDRAEVDVAGGRQHVHAVAAAAPVGTSIDGIDEGLEGTAHQVVGGIVVVAPLG